MPEYILSKPEERDYYPIEDSFTTRGEFLKVGDKKLLVWQKYQTPPKRPFVIVAGFVVSEVYKTAHGKDAVKCESISEKERSELEEVIRKEGFKGHINFN